MEPPYLAQSRALPSSTSPLDSSAYLAPASVPSKQEAGEELYLLRETSFTQTDRVR